MSSPSVIESPEEVLSTMDKSGKRKWVYPTPAFGVLWRARLLVGWALIALFVALPWIQINAKPAVFLDVARREFTFFGLTLHPTDTIILMVFLLTILVTVFFFTALFGRVWCGWGCPQTVYLEFVYRPVERLIEGKENKRRRRDAGPWTVDKIWRKSVKLTIFTVISLFLAHTFVAYFAGWHNLLEWMGNSPAESPGYFLLMAGTTALVLFDFGYFREQMCTITCPYARFQSVLLDENSLIVSYDPGRGEQRGTARDRRQAEKKLQEDHDKGPIDLDKLEAGSTSIFGDCVDCGACVRTCPVGIDIREGLQMECVSCTQCIDACNDIMDAVGTPRGLIRYTSERAIDDKPTKVARPRTIAYGIILLALSSVLVGLIANRGPLEVDASRASGTTYRVTGDDEVANRMRFRLRNRTAESVDVRLKMTSPEGAEIRIIGEQVQALAPGEIQRFEAWIVVPASEMPPGGTDSTFEISVNDEVWKAIDFRLLGPVQRTTSSE